MSGPQRTMTRRLFWIAAALLLPLPCLAESDEAVARYQPWSGSYWPICEGTMIRGPLAKYDAITGRASVAEEQRINYPDPQAPIWMGYCHAWAAAAVLDSEPTAPQSTFDRWGRSLLLSVGDQKGMLTACHTEDLAHHYGVRFDGQPTDDPQDIYPDLLWQVLQQYVADQGVPIIIDIDAGPDVWNYPVFRYRVDYQPLGVDGLYQAKMWLWAADDDVPVDYVGLKQTGLTYTFNFRLQGGTVIAGSGEWTGDSRNNHPDFAWYPYQIAAENKEVSYELVKQIIDPSRHGQLPGEASAPTAAALDLAATGVADTGLADTGLADTGLADTGLADTGLADTGQPDTGLADTGQPDTGQPDTGLAEHEQARPVNAALQPATAPPQQAAAGAVDRSPITGPGAMRVSLVVDHATRLYFAGEAIRVRVRSDQAGYLYLFYTDAQGGSHCLFPNKHQTNHHIDAQRTVRVPAPDADFMLKVGAPFGIEELEAVVSSQPLRGLDASSFTKSPITSIKRDKLKGVYVEASERARQASTATAGDHSPDAFRWGQAMIRIRTRPAAANEPVVHRAPEPVEQGRLARTTIPRRVGLFVGVGSYDDPGIRPLQAPREDARRFAKTMLQQGQLDKALVLVDRDATLDRIVGAISGELASTTKAGDLVLLYWSGHGGRHLDRSAADGFREFLIPYDGRYDDPQSTLADRQFGTIVRQLGGREVVVILDACHSGGQSSTGRKSVAAAAPQFGVGFLGQLRERTKGIQGRGTSLLASSQASQVSFERRSGDLSVMTHFLIRRLSDGQGPLTLEDAAQYVCQQVPAFVERAFPGTTQNPLFVKQTSRTIYIRP